MDSAALVRLLQHIRDQDLGVHSLLVARHGVLVLEAYFHPYGPETRHAIYSATKSFSSALIGIALADGAIPSVDTPLLDLFPGRSVANVDRRKQQITLEHLLTMSSGLDWRRPPGGIVPVRQWELSDDRVQFVLDRPVVDEPGSTFFYNSGGSHLLSAIVQECTGMSAAEYARIKLFEPLGVVDVQWQADPQGISEGSNGLWLRPRDMARFGLLHLRRGEWNGRQVLPASWMDTALSSRITLPREGRHGFERSPDLTGYGYQWWITPFGAALAMGYGGQEIIVVPEHDLVVVVTGSSPEVGPSTPEALTRTFIIPAVTSSTPSPENPAAYSRLVDLAAAASSPAPAPVVPLPAIAVEISGTTYRLESPAEPGSESLTLVFGPEPATAWLDLQRGREHITTVVGLDGIYRVTPIEGGQVALRGHWRDDTTFVLDMDRVGEAAREIGELTFSGDRLQVVYRVAAEGRELVLEGGRVAD
jgi:CubicO group peptidase (beta-lactamase class C family)